MTPGSEPKVREAVRSVISSQHPGIADEIQGAINTLRKLQDIAGAPGVDSSLPAVDATADGSSSVPAAENDLDDVNLLTAVSQTPEAARPLPLLAAGSTFGRYQIVRLLGRGAMGAVYLAYDPQLQRHVALKTPALGNCPRTVVARFAREAVAAARLRSPYTCPVYDVGQIGGIHYLSMAFIDGQPLSHAIAEGKLGDARAIAALTGKIARGLQKAHELRIIHRDLKPDNIMVDADGEPIVMDFGLARQMDDEVRVTLAGRLLGTPAYMSPEQVDSDPDKIGPATDIYSLGVVLYEMLTGQQPFRGSLTAILHQIVSTQPPPPSSLSPALGEGSPLECICQKMMARSAADRYPSMAAVAEALDEAFSSKRTPVNRSSLWGRLASWLGKLLPLRPAHSTPATVPVPANSGPAPNPAAVSHTPPAKDKTPQSADQTLDLPQSTDQPVRVAQSGDQTLDLPQSTDQSVDGPHTADRTLDVGH